MERLFRYSLERERAIRLLWQEEDGALRQGNAMILSFNESSVTFRLLRPKQIITLPLERLLAADFKKGDDGT